MCSLVLCVDVLLYLNSSRGVQHFKDKEGAGMDDKGLEEVTEPDLSPPVGHFEPLENFGLYF